MSRTEVREEKKDRYWVLRVDPAFNPENKKRGFQPMVTAFSDKDYSFEDHEYHWKRAEVSWYSIGSCDSTVAETYAKAITIATEYARKMDAEHGFPMVPVKPELVVTIQICSWCNSPRPIGVDGVDKIPPGRHEAKVQLSHGMCIPCEMKFSDELKNSGVTNSDTAKPDNETGKRGC